VQGGPVVRSGHPAKSLPRSADAEAREVPVGRYLQTTPRQPAAATLDLSDR
jgi:hypothetical protein